MILAQKSRWRGKKIYIWGGKSEWYSKLNSVDDLAKKDKGSTERVIYASGMLFMKGEIEGVSKIPPARQHELLDKGELYYKMAIAVSTKDPGVQLRLSAVDDEAVRGMLRANQHLDKSVREKMRSGPFSPRFLGAPMLRKGGPIQSSNASFTTRESWDSAKVAGTLRDHIKVAVKIQARETEDPAK